MKTVKQILSDIKKDIMHLDKNGNTSTFKNYTECTQKIRFINGISLHYAKQLGYTQHEVLIAFEKDRHYWSVNYYQKANMPRISKDIDIFNNMIEFYSRFPSKKFICPACKGESNDPQQCDSGLQVNTKSGICDWKSYGLFRTMGHGYRFLIKEGFLKHPIILDIFKPKELCSIKGD